GIRDLIVTGVQTCALPILAQAGEADPETAGLLAQPLVELPGQHAACFADPASIAMDVDEAKGGGRLVDVGEHPGKEALVLFGRRSEERRVGKEGRAR